MTRVNYSSGKNEKAINYFNEADNIIHKHGGYKDKLNLYVYEMEIWLSEEKSKNSYEKCINVLRKV